MHYAVLALSLLLSGNDTVRIDKTLYRTKADCEAVRVVMDKHPLSSDELKRFTVCVPVE